MSNGPLARLVGEAAGSFADTCWGRSPWHHKAGPGAFDDLLDIDAIDDLLDRGALRLPFARMVREGETLDPSRYTYRATVGSRPVPDLLDPARVAGLFADGATLVLQGLHRVWPPLRSFCIALSEQLAHPVQANAYLSTRANRGFDLHYDIHDVFVVQVAGSKAWEVFEPPTRWPTERWSPSPEAVASVEATGGRSLALGAGDCLYLPKGHPHRAVADDSVSLHVTIGVPTYSLATLLEEALAQALGDESLREPLAPGVVADPDRLAEALSVALAAFDRAAKAVEPAAVHERVAGRLARSRPPEPTTLLASIARLDELGPDSLLDCGPLAVRARHSSEVDGAGLERVVLHLPDRRISFPAGVAPAIEQVLASSIVRVGDLVGLDDDTSRLVLARRLLVEGAVRFAGSEEQS